MAHFPKPFFKQRRGLWYVEINRKQINLGPDRDRAFKRYHELMAQPHPKPEPEAPGDSVVGLIDRYLEWCQLNRSAATYEWYRWRLQLFAESIDRSLTVGTLKPYHIDEFLARHAGWKSGMKHGACRAVQRVLLWAEKKGHISRSRIAHYEKPSPGKRKVIVSPAQFETILAHVPSPNFQDLLLVTWETAARPQESLAVEVRHVDLANGRWVFPEDESKMEQWPRVVYLTDKALEITRRLLLKHPEGPLFRNDDGQPWKPYAVNCAFSRVQIRMGLEAMQEAGVPLVLDEKLTKKERRRLVDQTGRRHAKKYCLYHLRHSWLDRALKSGVDPLTCAILMGHRDPSTLTKVYQHLSQSPDYLRSAAKKAAG